MPVPGLGNTQGAARAGARARPPLSGVTAPHGMRPGAKRSQLPKHSQTPHQTAGSDCRAREREGFLGLLFLFWNIRAKLSEPEPLYFVEFNAFTLSVCLK